MVAALEAMPLPNMRPDDEAGEEKDYVYRSTFMFSATMPQAVERLAMKYFRRPVQAPSAPALPRPLRTPAAPAFPVMYPPCPVAARSKAQGMAFPERFLARLRDVRGSPRKSTKPAQGCRGPLSS